MKRLYFSLVLLLSVSQWLNAQQFAVSFSCDTCRAAFTGEVLVYCSKTEVEPRKNANWTQAEPLLRAFVRNLPPGKPFVITDKNSEAYPMPHFYRCYDRWRFAKNGFDFQKDLRVGDLIFQDLDCGPLCDAIEAVTEGAGGKDFSHLGLVVASGDSLAIVEAIGSVVQLTGVQKFIQRNKTPEGKNKVVVARLRPRWQRMAAGAAVAAKGMIGVPYDDAFLPDNGRLYCSEMVALAFQAANRGEPFFTQNPMTFKDPGTGMFFPAWAEYYQKLGLEIPEGRPGCNPGGLSRDVRVELIFSNF
jgi:hypothetical protein